MSMPAALYYTAEMVRALPDDGNRYETVHGELLVSPSPRPAHQVVLGNLFLALGTYLKDEGLTGLLSSPADISWSEDTLVQPDLFVVDGDELGTLDWSRMRTLYLAIEILSPSSVRADRFTKRRLYQEQQVPAYWIVDIDNRQVETWSPDALFPVIERERLVWRHPKAGGECRIGLSELFGKEA
jgi:Uma2 family endonuclease